MSEAGYRLALWRHGFLGLGTPNPRRAIIGLLRRRAHDPAEIQRVIEGISEAISGVRTDDSRQHGELVR